MADLVDLTAHLTRALPARIGASIGWHVGEHASRKTRVARIRSGGRVAADVGDHLHRHMFFRGEYEPAATAFVASIASPGWSVVDVGANVGYFSVLAADLGGAGSRVLAFEPHPRLFEMLTMTAASNPGAEILVQAAACGNAPGSATLHVSPDERNSGLGSLRGDLHDTNCIAVAVVRLDDVCHARGIRPDLVKIDAEGFELEVLQGCGALLEHRVPSHFLVELSPQRDDPADVIGLLTDNGYEPRQIRPDGSLAPLGPINHVYEDVCFARC
jgi:FkbM family methyltransferase